MLRYVWVSFVILASILAAGTTQDEKKKLEQYILEGTEKCKTPVTKFDFFSNVTKEDLKKLESCVFGCLMKDKGVLDDKGMFDLEKTNSIIEMFFTSPEDLKTLRQLMEDCSIVNEEQVSDGDVGCDRAMFLIQCFIDHKAASKIFM